MRKLVNLRELRERAALSQGELADRAGISKNAVGQLERGDFNPRPATVRRLAQALDVSPEELWSPKGLVPTSPQQEAKEMKGETRHLTAEEKLSKLPGEEQRLIAAAMSDYWLPHLPDKPDLPHPLSQDVVKFATRRLRELGLTLAQAQEALPRANPMLAKEVEQWKADARALKEKARRKNATTESETA